MSVVKKVVLLLKAQKAEEIEDEYEVMLDSKGYTVKQIKTLDFNYVNLNKLSEKLLKPNNYSGLIFSSPRCVNAVKLTLNKELHNDWKLKDNYVVGRATYKQALENLGLNCLGKDTGNANILSQEILKKKEKYSKSFLYPHGNLKMDILKSQFVGTNLSMDEVMVYETIPNKNIGEEFQNITSSLSIFPEYIVFFSPSGVKAFENQLENLPLKLIKMIAIGPTTETAMVESGIKIFKTAKKPTAQDILNILLDDV